MTEREIMKITTLASNLNLACHLSRHKLVVHFCMTRGTKPSYIMLNKQAGKELFGITVLSVQEE